MCGISGIVGSDRNKSNITSMVNTLHHRGPDHKGYFINQDKTVFFGHNHLCIIDLSNHDHQPMSNSDN